MELVREHWSKSDLKDFEDYLLSLSKGKEKGEWEKRIVNTKLDCIAVPSKEVDRIVKEISKGNFMEFINLWSWNNYTETSIIGKLICKIKDFDIFREFLTEYAERADNWATCDCLRLKVSCDKREDYYNLAVELINSEKPFAKRVGLNIFMALLKYPEFLDSIFIILNGFRDEENYYVNMMVAWIVSVCYIKYREKTLEFLKNHNLNKFSINKAISKCRDSFRVSEQDKEMLKAFRQV